MCAMKIKVEENCDRLCENPPLTYKNKIPLFLAIIIRNDIKNSRAKFHNDMKLSCQVIREYVYNTLLNKLPNYGFNTIRMLLVGTNRSQTV